MNKLSFMTIAFLLAFSPSYLSAQAVDNVTEIRVEGNAKVEPEAIVTIMDSAVGRVVDPETIADDIEKLFELGYFSDVRIFKETTAGGVKLIVSVKEKPAIVEIAFEGFEEVTEEDLSDKLETKIYTIVNEAKINSDLAIIDREYVNKGFYLARATYRLENINEREVKLIYAIDEAGKVRVGDVHILGNKYYTDTELIKVLLSTPLTRGSIWGSTESMFQDDFLKRDLEFLSLYYRDQGFMKVKISKPITEMDSDREFVRLTFQIEEGIQYSVSSIDISGDLLFPKEDLLEEMQLKPGELFRFSRFRKDLDMLIDKYGDLGYAFVDVNPVTTYDDEKATATIRYDITKGMKVYFGELSITGNTKTRDNVVRREFEIYDSERYSGTGLRQSKSNIERLGFFKQVQAIKERDVDDPSILKYNFKVEENRTGQLQAALGFQPGQSSAESSWFGQGKYSEENQSGYGWKTGLSARWNGSKTYSLETNFTNPRVNDSYWSLGFSGFLQNEVRTITDEISVQEKRVGGSVTVGRKIVELIRGTLTYRLSKITQTSEVYLIDKFKEEGIASSVIFGLRRNSTNNYLDPSDGSDLQFRHEVTGGLLGGDRQYFKTSGEATFYHPIDFSDTYRTYFRLNSSLSYIYPYGDNPVPLFERFQLGGPTDMRGFGLNSIGPKFNILQSPSGRVTRFNKGGDKELLVQLEYFVPLIMEANIKGVLFTDFGRVYDDDESIKWEDMKRDFGFGLRWITPIAPFRFEWAYPVENGEVGNLKFIFYLGY